MPITIPEALSFHDDAAVTKATTTRSNLSRYLLSSMLAGAFIGVAVLLLLMVSAPLVAAQNPATKLVQGAVFGIALTLVVFAGAELFTGNNMVMAQGLVTRKVKVSDLVLVWGASLIGNFIGSIAFAAMVNASGVVSTGGTAGKPSAYEAALAGIVKSKASLTGGQLFFRAVLCNMLVCLAMWMAARAASDAAKLICLWWALLAFIASGFEHSIANMTALGLAAIMGVGTWGDLGRNLLFTVPGNIVGGAVLVGLVYAWIGKAPREAAAVGQVPPMATIDLTNDLLDLAPAD
jgi:nitrite transporter NirC